MLAIEFCGDILRINKNFQKIRPGCPQASRPYFCSLALGASSLLYKAGIRIRAAAVGSGSNLNGLKSWLAGARNEADAKKRCSLPPLTSGGQVTLTQFVSRSYDYDYSCV